MSRTTATRVESADSFTAGDSVDTGAAAAVTTSAATPIDTVTRVAFRRAVPIPSATANAPTRPTRLAVVMIVPPSMSWRNDGHRVGCRVPRGESSLRRDGTSAIVYYCNLAHVPGVIMKMQSRGYCVPMLTDRICCYQMISLGNVHSVRAVMRVSNACELLAARGSGFLDRPQNVAFDGANGQSAQSLGNCNGWQIILERSALRSLLRAQSAATSR